MFHSIGRPLFGLVEARLDKRVWHQSIICSVRSSTCEGSSSKVACLQMLKTMLSRKESFRIRFEANENPNSASL